MSIICRTCLQNVDRSSYFYIDTFDNTQIPNTIPKDVLQLCVPEMDLYISEQPGICSDCLNMFESFYNFKNKCLASEDRILTYLKKNKISPQDKVNLTHVVYDITDQKLNHQPSFKHPEENALIDQPEDTDGFLTSVDRNYSSSNGHTEPLTNDNKEVLLLSCGDCSFVTIEKDKLTTHTCILSVDKYKCPYCIYSTNRRYRLSYHINSKHTKTKWYDCDQCDYKTTDQSSLKRHQKFIHSNKDEDSQVFACTICEFTSTSEVAVQRHRVSKHGPIIQTCEICSYQTKDRSNFRKHLYIHGDKPRKCTKCTYQCVSPYQLEKHYKKSHM